MRVTGTQWHADGFSAELNKVYEFHGKQALCMFACSVARPMLICGGMLQAITIMGIRASTQGMSSIKGAKQQWGSCTRPRASAGRPLKIWGFGMRRYGKTS